MSAPDPRANPILLGHEAAEHTLLDAIQLTLYGARARCSKRANLPFDEFLRESTHHGVNGAEPAGVSLSFRYAADGEEHLYDVSRTGACGQHSAGDWSGNYFSNWLVVGHGELDY